MSQLKFRVRSWVLVLYLIVLNILLMSSAVLSPLRSEISIFQVLFVCSILFIPGFLILQFIGYKETEFSTVVLYSLGLSLFFITVVCIFVDIFLQMLGLVPIRKYNLINSFFLVLLLLGYVVVRTKKDHIYVNIEYNIISTLSGLLFIFMVIFASLILRQNNIPIIILFIMLSILPILVKFKLFRKSNLMFLVWVLSFSLVMYNSLFSVFPRPTDNLAETMLIRKYVLSHGIWEQSVPSNILAMPSVVLLVPFLSFLVGGIINVYKYIIPFVSSFIPVAVYKLSETRYNKELAFYSSYFFSSLFVYFTWCSTTAKMTFAGLFLALIGLVLSKLSEDQITFNRCTKLILIIFSLGLIFSHYGTSAILAIVFALCLLSFKIYKCRSLSIRNYMALYIILFFSYSYMAAKGSILSSVTITIFDTLQHITNLFTPGNYGSRLVVERVPVYLDILRKLYILAFLFGLVEIVYLFGKKREIIDDFHVISLFFLIIIPIPYVFPVGQYGGGRAWYIPCIIVSPLIVSGLKRVGKFFRLNSELLMIFLILFFVFNSGLAAEVFWKNNMSASVYISYPRIVKTGSLKEREWVNKYIISTKDIVSARWIIEHANDNKHLFCGVDSLKIFGFVYGMLNSSRSIQISKTIKNSLYIYLNTLDFKFKLIEIKFKYVYIYKSAVSMLRKYSIIYSNNGSVLCISK